MTPDDLTPISIPEQVKRAWDTTERVKHQLERAQERLHRQAEETLTLKAQLKRQILALLRMVE